MDDNEEKIPVPSEHIITAVYELWKAVGCDWRILERGEDISDIVCRVRSIIEHREQVERETRRRQKENDQNKEYRSE